MPWFDRDSDRRARARAHRLATWRQASKGRAEPATTATPRRRPPAGPVIDVSGVHKTYAVGEMQVHALRGVSLRIERGEFVAIMGTSGSGKSTLMNILGCLDGPTRGEYRLDGRNVLAADEDALSDLRNRYIGFVFQSFNLIPRTSAVMNVELPLAYAGMPRGARRARALAALGSVGLSDRADHLPSELSGGQQQRVAVARALVTNPAMILADEPTGNLDTRSTHEVLEIFEALSAQGRTIVLITHEEDVALHARRVVRVRDGEIVSDTAGSDREDSVRAAVGDEVEGRTRTREHPGSSA